MDLQSVLIEALGQYVHDSSSIVFPLETNDEVIGKPHDEAVPPHPRLHFPHEPFIQYMVEKDIRQHGADDAPNANDNFCFDRVVKYVRAGKKT